jgi:hypothetical protein
MKKKCSQCKEIKNLNEFHKNQYICKFCRSINAKIFYEKNKNRIDKRIKEYDKTHPWIRTLVSINQRCNNPKNERYNQYGKRGIKNYLTKEDIKFLWVRDRAFEMMQPTIDRKDNDGHYELSNCQFLELIEHNKKSVQSKSRNKKGEFIKCY